MQGVCVYLDAGASPAPAALTTSQASIPSPPQVWVRELSKDSEGKLVPLEEADTFRVSPTANDIDGLAKAIAAERGLTPRYAIKVFQLSADAEWNQIKKRAQALQQTDEDTAYGFWVPQ